MPQGTDEIVAAGGLVRLRGPAGNGAATPSSQARRTSRVLLVHRPKYDDWSFPKGKADRGETIEQTALREVLEETGLVCTIICPLSKVRYTYLGKGSIPTPKIVHYFLMEPEGGSLDVDGYEIDLADWFSPPDALQYLTYDHDRKILNDVVRAGLF